MEVFAHIQVGSTSIVLSCQLHNAQDLLSRRETGRQLMEIIWRKPRDSPFRYITLAFHEVPSACNIRNCECELQTYFSIDLIFLYFIWSHYSSKYCNRSQIQTLLYWWCTILVIGPSLLVYTLIESQQMHQMTTLLWCPVKRSYMFRRTNAIIRELIWSSQATCLSVCITRRIMEFRTVSIVTLWKWVVMTNFCWKQWTVVEYTDGVYF
jgi:hypothetical protein